MVAVAERAPQICFEERDLQRSEDWGLALVERGEAGVNSCWKTYLCSIRQELSWLPSYYAFVIIGNRTVIDPHIEIPLRSNVMYGLHDECEQRAFTSVAKFNTDKGLNPLDVLDSLQLPFKKQAHISVASYDHKTFVSVRISLESVFCPKSVFEVSQAKDEITVGTVATNLYAHHGIKIRPCVTPFGESIVDLIPYIPAKPPPGFDS